MDTETIWLVEEKMILRRPGNVSVTTEGIYNEPHTIYASRVKRFIDIVFSSVLILLFLSWITPILFILIRLSSPGPLFFVQARTGYLGKSFSCIKFRTMRLNDDCEAIQAGADDERITGIGRFLRITHIDELPQLINVLWNDMSIVGPRPHMLCHDALFSALLPHYPARHLVKPGITGLAQSLGYHGATPDFFSISDRTRLDLLYVKRISPGLDLKIIWNTFFIIPVKRSKHGSADDNRGI